MNSVGDILLPPTPQPGGGLPDFPQRVAVWTRICEQTIRRFKNWSDDVTGAINGLHSPTGGFTNLTEFTGQGNWKLFYSDGSGDVQELAIGASGYALVSQGLSAVPTWSAIPTPFTNLTQFVSQNPNKLFYSDDNGDVQELAFSATPGDVLVSKSR